MDDVIPCNTLLKADCTTLREQFSHNTGKGLVAECTLASISPFSLFFPADWYHMYLVSSLQRYTCQFTWAVKSQYWYMYYGRNWLEMFSTPLCVQANYFSLFPPACSPKEARICLNFENPKSPLSSCIQVKSKWINLVLISFRCNKKYKQVLKIGNDIYQGFDMWTSNSNNMILVFLRVIGGEGLIQEGKMQRNAKGGKFFIDLDCTSPQMLLWGTLCLSLSLYLTLYLSLYLYF